MRSARSQRTLFDHWRWQRPVPSRPRPRQRLPRDFLFAPEQGGRLVKALWGGERTVCCSAPVSRDPRMCGAVQPRMTSISNVERPRAASGWSGTLLLVSHDRAFMDHVVTTTLRSCDGHVREYAAVISWLRQRPPAPPGRLARGHLRPSIRCYRAATPATSKICRQGTTQLESPRFEMFTRAEEHALTPHRRTYFYKEPRSD